MIVKTEYKKKVHRVVLMGDGIQFDADHKTSFQIRLYKSDVTNFFFWIFDKSDQFKMYLNLKKYILEVNKCMIYRFQQIEDGALLSCEGFVDTEILVPEVVLFH